MAVDGNGRARKVPYRIEHPERIPKQRYYDEEFFRLEKELFWPRVWQMACRLEEIPEVGDWVEYKILDQSVIVVRTANGANAFHNACRHRGMKLAAECGNARAEGFICPFHGWRWNMDGQNTFVWGKHLFSDEAVDAAQLALPPCRVELWGGCAFINFDDNAAPLLDYIGPLAERLDPHNVEQLRYEWRHEVELAANWKLAMEAFMEGMHVMRTHPQLHQTMLPGMERYANPPRRDAPPPPVSMTSREAVDKLVEMHALRSEGMGGMVHANDMAVMRDIKDKVELPDDPRQAVMHFNRALNDEIVKRGRASGKPIPDLNERADDPAPLRRFAFPNLFMLTQFANVISYRIRPLTAESCLFEVGSLIFYPSDEKRPRTGPAKRMAYDDPDHPLVTKQDFSNIPRQQEGLHVSGFVEMRLSRAVEGLISNYQRLLDGFLAGLGEEQLVEASRIVSAGVDWPIEDIGFGPAPAEVVGIEKFSPVPKL